MVSTPSSPTPRLYGQRFMNVEEIPEILGFWGLVHERMRPDLGVVGSPNRTVYRAVVEDAGGCLYVLEEIAPELYSHKLEIIQVLDDLHARGLKQVQPYVKNGDGVHIQKYENRFFQILAHIDGVEVPRPEYICQGWRAKPFSDFLLALQKTSEDIPVKNPFSLKRYVYGIHSVSEKHHPDVHGALTPIVEYLEKRFMDAHDGLVVRFCHGDCHVLNCIWSETGIKKVIDWEFAGSKLEAYDLANLVGCIGIEDPDALAGALVVAIVNRLKDHNYLSQESWENLIDTMIALRFAWMSEWFRHRDMEMVEMELEYMWILVREQERLKNIWGI